MRLRKLLNVSLDEISFRSKAVLKRWYEGGCYTLGLERNPQARLLPVDPEDIVFQNPWVDSKELEPFLSVCQSSYPDYVRATRQAADRICDRQFTLFDIPVQYDGRLPWCADPISRKPWPMKFHTHMEIFEGNTGNGDVKYVWELNRHQFLPILGKAYCLTGNEKYASTCLELMEDWIHANPYKIGINWTSALEVAIRALSWCWTCGLIERSKDFDLSKRQNILHALYQHGRYIEEHLSFFFSPYNHLIGEVTALFVLGGLLPWLRCAGRWRDKGWEILVAEMPKQFHPDGGTVEQATGYHHFTLGFYLQAVLLRRRLSLPVPSSVLSLLEKTFEFSMYMARPDGSMPMIGDVDDGKAMALDQPSQWDFRCFLAIGAVLFQRGDFKKMTASFPPDAIWLVGREGQNDYQTLSDEEPRMTSKAMLASGYCIMRTDWGRQAHYLNFDCGEIADGVPKNDVSSAAHGHADALSIEVASYGTTVLVDPGLYTYNGELIWHRYFRETEAHNTVVVDHTSQAEYRGRLKWSCAPQVTFERWVGSRHFDYAEGFHNGYQRLSQPVMHRRAVAFFKPDFWLIRDELTGQGEHQLDRYFHFAPEQAVCQIGDGLIQTCVSPGGNLGILAVENKNLTIEISVDGEEPGGGWLATGYGRKVRAPVVRYRQQERLPSVLHTLLIPFRDTLPEIKVESCVVGVDSQAINGQALTITAAKTKDIMLFSTASKIIQFDENWESDARVAWIRLDGNGDVIACALLDGSLLRSDSKMLLHLEKRIRFAALSLEEGESRIELSESSKVLTSYPSPCIMIASNSHWGSDL